MSTYSVQDIISIGKTDRYDLRIIAVEDDEYVLEACKKGKSFTSFRFSQEHLDELGYFKKEKHYFIRNSMEQPPSSTAAGTAKPQIDILAMLKAGTHYGEIARTARVSYSTITKVAKENGIRRNRRGQEGRIITPNTPKLDSPQIDTFRSKINELEKRVNALESKLAKKRSQIISKIVQEQFEKLIARFHKS